MAARRGKSQARRNSGNGAGGLPGWAWMVLGIVLTIGVVLAAPKFLKSGQADFIRPHPNPDAQPAATAEDDDAIVADDDDAPPPSSAAKPTQYDFYKLLPGNEVAMSDAELAATERAEAARGAATTIDAATTAAAEPDDAATPATPVARPADSGTATVATAPAPAPASDTPYVLQAGAYGASGDAEAVKAKIAMLGLSARVESAQITGKTVYRVRMGPYGTASELAEAKRKLAGGGLPALAIKAR